MNTFKFFLGTGALVSAIATPVHAGQVITDGQDIILSTKGGLRLQTADGKAGFQIGGRLHMDYTLDNTDTAANGSQRLEDFDLRRARILLRGFYNDFEVKFDINASESGNSGGSAEEAYLRYSGFGEMANITVGKQRVPFGMDVLTSSNDVSVLERAAMSERYSLPRSTGVKLSGTGLDKKFTYGVGIFEGAGDGANDFEDRAMAARITYAPILTGNTVLHFGAGVQTVANANPNLETDTYNLEVAGAIGRFHGQAEYFSSDVGNRSIDGYYLQAGYLINGGSRPYRDGVFRRVKPNAGGTWEAVARYENGDGRFSDIGLGSIDGSVYVLGLNYYMTDNARFAINYMDGESADGRDTGDELRVGVRYVF